ncbi:DUF1840 domain-containing protein [Immundisolibacter sp.]|uniref:DUF1840 domain-containing protein n=1 Tax=Immundisolibacter sp. TaxID=1934948 RepID=UPI0019B04315|nr:DUF1840 domain-containing protein [Immundisolibacter sp.]MBC7161302.1 DUF1840 domain-containing protein [Immundisolibacter sp.]MEA3218959.1 hypothetical protein [Immundisolibacter sp.]
MLVTFTTDNYGDVIMFGEVALAMLRMMGHSPTVPGAILAADVPAALARLRDAIAQAKAEPPVVEEEQDQDQEAAGEPAVSLSKRALPLIKLLEAAAESNSRVMWK